MATEVASRPTSDPSLLISGSAPAYERHRPEETALHTVVREQLETFLARAREGDRPVPLFIEQELRAYLRCGILAHGFLRLRCDACGNDRLEVRPDGRLALRLKTRWRDGTTHILMERHELLERLVPLIPAPRAHQVRYHGVLAPCAPTRGATRCCVGSLDVGRTCG